MGILWRVLGFGSAGFAVTVLIVYGMTRLVDVPVPEPSTSHAELIRFFDRPPPEPVPYRKRSRPPPIPPREPMPETARAPVPAPVARPSIATPHREMADLLSLYRPQLQPAWRGGDLLAGGLIPKAMLPPIYPYRALLKGIEGEVVVGFEVGELGEVVRVWVVSARPDNDVFVDATLNAVSKWRFRPPRDAEGRPISVQGQQTIGFVLRDALPTAEPVAGSP